MSYTADSAIERANPAPKFPTAPRTARITARPQTGRPRRAPSAEEVLEHYLKRVDPEVAASFSEPQRQAIKSILGARGMTKHAVEVRRSIPFARWRFYVVFLVGKEQRSLRRLRQDGAISRPFNVLVYLAGAALLSACGLGAFLALNL